MSQSDWDTPEDRAAKRDWLLSQGFVWDGGNLAKAWSKRGGYDFTDLEFYPGYFRFAGDSAVEAIVGCHASGENPRLAIGCCDTLADVQAVVAVIERINGYKPAREYVAERLVTDKSGTPEGQ